MFAIGFLWHMHQPMYVNPLTQLAELPWVRLHATRAYYDMVRLALDYPELHMTYNLTTVLVDQLEQLSQGAKDRYRLLSEIPAESLTGAQSQFMVEMFFQCNWARLVHSNPGYQRLLSLRGGDKATPGAAGHFKPQDLRDLQVWFNLAWFGFTALREYPVLQDLIARQKGFSEEDKLEVLSIQDKIVASILPLYRKAVQSNVIELTTSPYYHPILPLLIHTDVGGRALRHASLPHPPFSWPEDAHAQIDLALERMEQVFGKRPTGMWPSEGSVSPELIPLLERTGLKWIATSEGILNHSTLDPRTAPDWLAPGNRPSALRPYSAGKIAMFFRHLDLSDRVGFTYSHMSGADAAADFIARARETVSEHRGSGVPMLPIILDGENPWEHYPGGGEPFLRSLIEGIIRAKGVAGMGFTEYLSQNPPKTRIQHLWSGSWIDSNFKIWMGHPEDLTAWHRLREARQALAEHAERNEVIPKSALHHLYAAEGSDWFWWYGDEFSSAAELEFDALFRAHLKAMYQELGMNPPENVNYPIKGFQRFTKLPSARGIIRPSIDGQLSHWWEWEEAGKALLSATGGAMARGDRLLRELWWGCDEQDLFFRVDYGEQLRQGETTLEMHFLSPVPTMARVRVTRPTEPGRAPMTHASVRSARGPRAHELAPGALQGSLPPLDGDAETSELDPKQELPLLEVRSLLDADHSLLAPSDHQARAACGDTLELAMPRSLFRLEDGGLIEFYMLLHVEGQGTFRYPGGEVYQLEVPARRVSSLG